METNFSYLFGQHTSPLQFTTIPNILDRKGSKCKDKPANIFRVLQNAGDEDSCELTRQVVTYGDLAERSFSLAASLLRLGLKPGDSVAVLGGNSPEWLYLDYACIRIKILMIRIPGNLIFHDALVDIISKNNCRAFFLDEGDIARDIEKVLPGFLSGNLSDEDGRRMQSLEHVGFLKGLDGPSERLNVQSMCTENPTPGDVQAVRNIQNSIDPDDIATALPTSGSTGFPKFVIYSHFKIINNIDMLMDVFKCTEHGITIRVATDRPFSWIGGLVYASVVGDVQMIQMDSRINTIKRRTEITFKVNNQHVKVNSHGFLSRVYIYIFFGSNYDPLNFSFISSHACTPHNMIHSVMTE